MSQSANRTSGQHLKPPAPVGIEHEINLKCFLLVWSGSISTEEIVELLLNVRRNQNRSSYKKNSQNFKVLMHNIEQNKAVNSVFELFLFSS